LGLISIGPAAPAPSPEGTKLSFRARLIDAGGESFAVRIDLEGPSPEEEILRLYRHWSLGDLKGFLGTFRSLRRGSLRFVGGSGLTVPFHVAKETSIKAGIRILLVGEGRRSFIPGTRKRVIRTDRFLAVALDVDAEGRGEGLIYEDAEIDFERADIVLRSFVMTPKRLINVAPVK
jgi:hypothetical protein